MRTQITLAIALAAAAASGLAGAVPCYTLLDKGDRLLYQSSTPPIDLSDQGKAARQALRRSNEFLIISEVDTCPAAAAVAGTSGYRPATVDEIVGQMRGYLSYQGGSFTPPGPTPAGGASGGDSGGAPAAPAAARGAGGGSRGGY